MNFLRLFRRDCVYYRKPFVCLSAAACLVCAILTSALLIGDSVRGTLYDNLNRNTAFAKTVIRFPQPVATDVSGGVLHTCGYIAPGIKTQVSAFADASQIQGRDAYCSRSLAEKLQLNEGDLLTVRVQTISPIKSEMTVGRPPELKQIQLVYRGILPNGKADVNFENPQHRADNLFLNHNFLTQSLDLLPGVVNEIWLASEQETPVLSDETIWELSQLYFDDWNGRPVLKCKAFFLPQQIAMLFPEASRGAATFAESLSDGTNTLNYFFVGAFDGDIFHVEKNHAILSDVISENMSDDAVLTYFSTNAFREIVRCEFVFPQIAKASDANMSDAFMPEIPGLTDASDCSDWEAGLPVDFEKVKNEDEKYWGQHKSKPKLYMNFEQAQKLFFPEQCTALIFNKDAEVQQIRQKIIAELQRDSQLYQTENVFDALQNNIEHGIPFATLFLGLSFFIIVSALLVLAMLLKLHLFDRSREMQTLANHTACKGKLAKFHLVELIAVLIPGMLAGLLLGGFICRLQLLLLEHVWNDIIRMNRLAFHSHVASYFIAFGVTLVCSLAVIIFSFRLQSRKMRYFIATSRPPRSVFALATLSFFRRWGQYRLCTVLLVMGFLGTLGVGAFGIKSRGEDGFSFMYIAETALPVVPSYDAPFPLGALPVRVWQADSADCSNILRAETPTVYGCDVQQLTGEPQFLDDFSAAADAGSMQWIMKKKIGDVIVYPQGQITLQRSMKATVFQRGLLVDNATFEKLFPDTQGAQFFLIRDQKTADIYRQYLEPYGVTIVTTDAFMAEAESFQNRYLAIFLQLGMLGFILGIGSLLLLVVRNLHAQRNEMRCLYELGFSRRTLFWLHYMENLWLYLASAFVSLAVLCLLACVAQLHVPTLFGGWLFLTACGVAAIFATLDFARK